MLPIAIIKCPARVESKGFTASHAGLCLSDGSIRFYDIASGRLLWHDETNRIAKLCVLSADGSWLAASHLSHAALAVYDARIGEHRWIIARKHVTCCQFSPDNQMLAVGTFSGTVRLWCLRQGGWMRTIVLNQCPIDQCVWRQTQRQLAVMILAVMQVVIYDAQTSQPVQTINVGTEAVFFSQDGCRLAAFHFRRKCVYIYDLNAGSKPARVYDHVGDNAAFAATGPSLFFNLYPHVRELDTDTGLCCEALPDIFCSETSSVTLSADAAVACVVDKQTVTFYRCGLAAARLLILAIIRPDLPTELLHFMRVV